MPARETAIISRLLEEKDRGLISGAEMMRDILADLRRQVMNELGRAALGSWDAYHLRQTLSEIENQMANYAAKAKAEISGLMDKAWEQGKSVVDTPLAEGGIYTGFHLSTSVLETLKEYSNDYLENLFGDAWYKIKGKINLGMLGNKTPQQVAEALGESIDAGRWGSITYRAELITKTEMGTAFSQATQNRMAQAAEHVPGLEKQWLHAGHPKVARPTHVATHGKHVPVSEPFNVGGVMMMFPRAPGAPLDEVINCGCDHVPYHAAWA